MSGKHPPIPHPPAITLIPACPPGGERRLPPTPSKPSRQPPLDIAMLNLSGPMARAFKAVVAAGRLNRYGCTYGAEAIGHRYQQSTIAALIATRIIRQREPRPKHVQVVVSAYGRLFV